MEHLLNNLAEKPLRRYVVYAVAILVLGTEECKAAYDLYRSQVFSVLGMGFPQNHASHPVIRVSAPLMLLADKVGIHYSLLLKCCPSAAGIQDALKVRTASDLNSLLGGVNSPVVVVLGLATAVR